jgi:quinohemoprotein ethanol dehydrogenase
VFRLGGGPVPLPPLVKHELQPTPAAITQDPAIIKKGESLIGRCAGCHGFRGIPNAYPDLWNLPAATHAAFESIVYEGALSHAGMPSFKDALSLDDVKAIHAFVVADEIALRQVKK